MNCSNLGNAQEKDLLESMDNTNEAILCEFFFLPFSLLFYLPCFTFFAICRGVVVDFTHIHPKQVTSFFGFFQKTRPITVSD